jgi:two-component system phosphate regulon response regulator PhoB
MKNFKTQPRFKILVVEKNRESAAIIKHSLNMQSVECILAENGNEAIKLAKENNIDVAIINYDISIISGMGLCSILKTKSFSKNILILFISRRSDRLDQIKGLDKSFDDYLIFPFPASDLMLKVTELLKKKHHNFQAEQFNYGDLSLDSGTLKVLKSGKEIRLKPKEIRMLQFFMGNPERVFTRDEILSYVWGSNNSVDPRTVDVHINRLRTALNSEMIKTIRSFGYTLEKRKEG